MPTPLPERKTSFRLPRLSRTSVFMPTIIPASSNPDARRISDTIDVSPMTSQIRFSAAESENDRMHEEDGEATPVPPRTALDNPSDYHDELNDSEKKERNDSTSTSATGPAGSGMPPAEAAFTSEKEVVGIDKQEMRPLGILRPQQRIRSAILSVPPRDDSPRLVQSPRPKSAMAGLTSIGVEGSMAEDMDSTASNLARIGSSFNSESSLDTFDSRRSVTEEGATIILQTAQSAQKKRPSVVHHNELNRSGSDVSGLTRFILHRDDQFLSTGGISRSQSVAVGDPSRERIRWSRDPGLVIYAEDTEPIGLNDNSRIANPPNSPDPAMISSSGAHMEYAEKVSLQDALKMRPFSSSVLPKRSTTVPSSVGNRRKARFSPLAINSKARGSFSRDSIVSTPYPKEEEGGEKSKEITDTTIPNDSTVLESNFVNPRPLSVDVAILARSRMSVVSVSLTENEDGHRKRRWKTRRSDDERLMTLLKKEFGQLQGKARSYLGAKTAKAARIKLVRADKADAVFDFEGPLIREYLGFYAENDFWHLWCNPAQGYKRRNWLNALTLKAKRNGSSWITAFEISEGYDAVRIITAFSVVTAVSLMAMFFWLFLGVGGEGNTTNVADGNVLKPTSIVEDTAERAGDSFLFGIWVLFIGWTGVAGWILVS